MAASTAGHVTLQNLKTGNTRIEPFTMTPTDGQRVTWTTTGGNDLLIAPEGEQIVDIQINNDGVTTVTQGQIFVDGADIRVRFLLVFLAADNDISNRWPSPVRIGGSKQIQLQVHA